MWRNVDVWQTLIRYDSYICQKILYDMYIKKKNILLMKWPFTGILMIIYEICETNLYPPPFPH